MNVEHRILNAAGHLIGAPLTGMSVIRRGHRNLVLQAQSRSTQGPGEVMIKAATGGENLLANERAALQFLGAAAETAQFAPRLLATNPDSTLVVTERVSGETLAEILENGDGVKARRAIMTVAQALGRLHAATVGRVDEWAALRGAQRKTPSEQAEAFRELVPSIVRFCERAGVTLPADFRDELGTVARALEQPGELLAFTVGDMAPSNVILAAETPVFVDFEYAGFRHSGYEAAFWHAICPFPENVAEEADHAYWVGWSEAASGRRPSAAFLLAQTATLAAHRAFWSLTWSSARIWEADFEEMPGVSARLLRRVWLRGVARIGRRAAVLPTLVSAARDLDAALGRRWPETNAPIVLFPAFGEPV